MTALLHELVFKSAERAPDSLALRFQGHGVTYSALAQAIARAVQGFLGLDLARHERVAVYLDKRPETVVAMFGAAAAGGAFVPINPLLKSEQVAYILRDCNVRVLVTSHERLQALAPVLAHCHDLRAAVLINGPAAVPPETPGLTVLGWEALLAGTDRASHRNIDSDMAAILYTSGSTGRPKGVVLSHRNMVTGTLSVAEYLQNRPSDRLLAVLPFSFDYGFSQLSTAFARGACTVLMNYLFPRDVLTALEQESVTGMGAVPPLWIQLAQLDWPAPERLRLRYLTNSGGAMPRSVVEALRRRLPNTQIFLMYGLTEAFRSTYLPPAELERRPDSIGRAIPNAEILVVRPDGTACAPGEPGELVHRGPLVALGYWNDPEKTAERFRPAPSRAPGIMLPEIAVWSGDTVRADDEGFLYFVARQDEMIKTSGYRVSPTEIEEVIYATGLVAEAVALGVAHPVLGQAIVALVVGRPGTEAAPAAVLAECKRRLPAYMVPARIEHRASLPRNPNGKIDRKALAAELAPLYAEPPA